MKVAVIRFPGSNCDQDAFHALKDELGILAEYVWHESTSLLGFDAVFLPGGFSYGDYLRCGAMASRAPVMSEVHRFVDEGRLVLGACNGFQMLCEAGILPGALVKNRGERFICKRVKLATVNRSSPWTSSIPARLSLPIAHGEGRYVVQDDELERLLDEDRIAFRYVNDQGEPDEISNVNGSCESIAGVVNRRGNVLGLMPHPERAARAILGNREGMDLLEAFRSAA